MLSVTAWSCRVMLPMPVYWRPLRCDARSSPQSLATVSAQRQRPNQSVLFGA
jgi:hypothetical protein